MSVLGFTAHDHSHCIEEAVTSAQAHCVENGLQLTTVRQRVLEVLLEKHRAMGAYEILDVLRDEGLGSQPPVAYRALEFLTKHGFAHRIEGLNAFIACTTPNAPHAPAFLICRKCDAVAETQATLGTIATDSGFKVEQAVVEVKGVCPNCSDQPE